MTRLWSTLGWDVRSQLRQGLYVAAGVVIVIWTALFWQLPASGVGWLLPFAVFMDLSVFGFYFMAAILYLEKGDGVLEALVVTPLRRGEYLAAKLVSLTLLAVVATVVVVGLSYRGPVNWLMLLMGVVMNSWVMVLTGFVVAARYNGISEFLIPSMIWMVPTQLPLLDFFGIWQSPLIYVIPTQPTMLLIAGAFAPIAPWQLVYAVAYLVVAALVVTWLALRTFDRFVVQAQRR